MSRMRDSKVDFHVKSRSTMREFTFKWTIENFLKFVASKQVDSPSFYPEVGCRWWTRIEKNGSKLTFSVFRSPGFGDIVVQSKLVVTDSTKKVWLNDTFDLSFNNSHCAKVLINSLETRSEKLKIGDNVDLDLELHLKIFSTKTEASKLPSEVELRRNVQKSMCDDMIKLYESQMATDFSLCVAGDNIGVHRTVLCARSSVFAKMFQQEMAERKQNVVEISDIRMPIVKELVDFMYSKARFDYDFETAMEMYYAADKYDVTELFNYCSDFLISKVNVQNAGELLQLGDRHNDASLKKQVMKFISAEMKSCIKTNWWWDLMKSRSELAVELENFIANSKF